jgi:hypothetical protein
MTRQLVTRERGGSGGQEWIKRERGVVAIDGSREREEEEESLILSSSWVWAHLVV